MDDATEQTQAIIAMADCMDMVRRELVEAGVIGADVAPMFVADAVLACLGRMRAAFHVNMVRAYPDRTHDEIAAEIDKACGSAPNSREFAGIGKSVTVTEKGPWQVNDWGQGRIVIQSDDFTHDVALEISGDFGSVERERAHAEEIARRLNSYRVRPYTLAIAAAAEGYVAQFASAHPLPAQWRWTELWHAMEHAAVTDRDLYTCIGKGGTYENLGHARGAGEKRGNIVTVYRDVQTGALYYRDPVDFGERMERIEDKA